MTYSKGACGLEVKGDVCKIKSCGRTQKYCKLSTVEAPQPKAPVKKALTFIAKCVFIVPVCVITISLALMMILTTSPEDQAGRSPK